MYRNPIILMLAAAAYTTAAAGSLSPTQSLQRALGRQPGLPLALSIAPADQATPLLTVDTQAGTPGLYVFGGDNGFVITPADDRAEPLLAYGTSPITPGQMPPAMNEWLRHMARQIGAAAVADAPPTPGSGTQWEHAPIDPLITTFWDQGYPYNEYCPIWDSRNRCVTGCVATAIAQIMNYHRWPEHGTGSGTHTDDINGTTCNITADYGNTEYKWDDMPRGNQNQYTPAQVAAVATLMRDLGVASQMDYGESGLNQSGASILQATIGAVEHFSYSRSARYFERNFYSDSIWDDAIYSELAAGRPVLYSGYGASASDGGHAFVCDGYQGSGFYHFNWGWSGVGDGYYKLSALTPGNTGGAGGGSYNFSYNQIVVLGIEPDRDSTSLMETSFYMLGDLSVRKPIYTYPAGVQPAITGTTYNGFYSYNLFGSPTTSDMALQFTDDLTGATFITSPLAVELKLYNGVSYYTTTINQGDIPPGDYIVVPVTRASGDFAGSWRPGVFYPDRTSTLKARVNKYSVMLHNSTTTATILTVDHAEAPQSAAAGEPFTVKADITVLYNAYNGIVRLMTPCAGGNFTTIGTAAVNLEAGQSTTIEIEGIATGSGQIDLVIGNGTAQPVYDGLTIDLGEASIAGIGCDMTRLRFDPASSTVVSPYSGISVYSASGVLAASSSGTEADLSALAPGFYIIRSGLLSSRIAIK